MKEGEEGKQFSSHSQRNKESALKTPSLFEQEPGRLTKDSSIFLAYFSKNMRVGNILSIQMARG